MAKAPDFKYAPMFQLGEDKTEYRLISKEGVSTAEFEGKTILKVLPGYRYCHHSWRERSARMD